MTGGWLVTNMSVRIVNGRQSTMILRLAFPFLFAILPAMTMAWDLTPPKDLVAPPGMSATTLITAGQHFGDDATFPLSLTFTVELQDPSPSSAYASEVLAAFDLSNFSIFGNLSAINLDTGEKGTIDASSVITTSPQKKSFVYGFLTNPQGANMRYQQVFWIVHPDGVSLSDKTTAFPKLSYQVQVSGPITVPMPSVPEPDLSALAIAGVAMVSLWSRRRQTGLTGVLNAPPKC
jgi:hypothetical protein